MRTYSWISGSRGFLALSICAISSTAVVFAREWVPTGPPCREVHEIAIDHTDPATIWARAGSPGRYSSLLYKSTDRGLLWKRIQLRLDEYESLEPVFPDPKIRGKVFVPTTDGRLLTSDDTGRTWIATKLDHAIGEMRRCGRNYNRVCALSGSVGVCVSDDDGKSWRVSRAGLPRDVHAISIVVDPSVPETIYLGALSSGDPVYRSEDSGNTWESFSEGLPRYGTASSLAVGAEPKPDVFVMVYGTLYARAAGDGAWSRRASIGRTVASVELAAHPTRPDKIYAGAPDGFFSSSDGGATWKRSSRGLPYVSQGVSSVALDPLAPARLFIGTSQGVFARESDEESWQPRMVGMESGVGVTGICLDPVYSRKLCIATYAGIYRSDDRGRTWRPSNRGFAVEDSVVSLFQNPSVPETLLAGTDDDGLYISTNYGKDWTKTSLPSGNLQVGPVAIDPRRPETILASITYDGIYGMLYRSTDGGKSWTISDPNRYWPYAQALAFHPVRDGVVYAGTYPHGLFRSTDSGATWHSLSSSLSEYDVRSVAFDPHQESTIYVGSVRGLFKSEDGGASWTSLGFSDQTVTSIVVNPAVRGDVRAGVSGHVWEAHDGGTSWRDLTSESPFTYIYSILMAPSPHPGVIYVGTDTQGLYAYR